uniref:Uncharacterized protein n=1 Tax=viral metagenome TaxID=1070528 RepID=A0A6H2A607_9ZZZZ
MVVKVGNRISRPSDWTEVEPGQWEIKTHMLVEGKPVKMTHVAFGNVQCMICGEPIQAITGESDKCNECFHARARYLQGKKLSRAWTNRIREWIQGDGEKGA